MHSHQPLTHARRDAQALQIQVLSLVFNWIANTLNNWENHRTRTAYEDNLIFKTFAFQLFNNYGALAYTAFFKQMSEQGCQGGDCMEETRQLLLIIFVTRMGMNVVEIGLPMWSNRQRLAAVKNAKAHHHAAQSKARMASGNKDVAEYHEKLLGDCGGGGDDAASTTSSGYDMEMQAQAPRGAGGHGGAIAPFEMESKLAVSDDTLSDYAEMVLQVLTRLDLISSRADTQLLTNRYVPTPPHSPNCCSTASSSCSWRLCRSSRSWRWWRT
jgi:hypothetical protein